MMSFFWCGFEKQATSQEETERKITDATIGAASGLAGAAALHKAKPLVTGRTTLYHGTHADAAKDILRNGLRTGKPGIADMLEDKIKAKDYSYMTPYKSQANFYARQAESLRMEAKNNPGRSARENSDAYIHSGKQVGDTNKSILGPGNGKVLKAHVPLWKTEHFKNPELRGTKNGREWMNETAKVHPMIWLNGPNHGNEMYKALDVPAFKHLGPEHFKGSPHYKKLGLKEIGQYAKAKPGRFATGVALGTAGVAGLGYSAKKFRDAVKDKCG